MRDPARISGALEHVERLWRLYPDWRLGQLLANVAGWADQSVWDIEDDVLISEIQKHVEQSQPTVQTNQ